MTAVVPYLEPHEKPLMLVSESVAKLWYANVPELAGQQKGFSPA